MGTKEKPGQFDCYASLEPDEPFFVLKASDPSAAMSVLMWAELYRERKQRAGAWNPKAVARYCEAHEVANQMYEYRARKEAGKDEPIPFTVTRGVPVKLAKNSTYGKVGGWRGGRIEKFADGSEEAGPVVETDAVSAYPQYYGAGSDAAGMLERMAVHGAQSEPPAGVLLAPEVPEGATPIPHWKDCEPTD